MNKPRTVFRVGLAAALVAVSAGMASAQTSVPAASDAERAAEKRILEALARSADVRFDQTPLAEVLRFVEQSAGISVVIDGRAVDDVGRDLEIPVTLAARGIPLAGVLDLALEQHNLTWLIRYGMIAVTTVEEAELSGLEIRVYPVRDLISTHPVDPDYGPDFDSLIDLIVTTVAPDSWDEVGGPGSIREYEPAFSLVIAQRRDVHADIEELFRALREVQSSRSMLQRSSSGGSVAVFPPAARRPAAGMFSVPSRSPEPRRYQTWQLPRVHE